jgi:ATP-binding protein involved in chromosome partitioning
LIDPRISVIAERLSCISRIIAVSSGKGGVGKSMIAVTLALSLSKKGCKVGLFDLDFTGPSTHIILGAKNAVPKEEKGLVPPTVHNLEYMSLIYFVGDNPAPLRGADVSNALIELLTITKWSKLDFLVIDMPPGIGDAILDLIRLVERLEFLIVTTPSLLAFQTVKKQVSLLCELKMPLIGLIENMKLEETTVIALKTEELGIKYLGTVPFDPEVEEAIGNSSKLFDTAFAQKIQKIAEVAIFSKKREP